MVTNSLLTETQRKYLQMTEEERKEEYTKQQRSYHRSSIRDRLQASIFDLQLIVSELSLDEIDKALSEPEADSELEQKMPFSLEHHMRALPALLYLYHREDEKIEGKKDGWRTALDTSVGIAMALAQIGVGYETIDVDIEVVRKERRKALEELAELTREKLGELHRAGVIDSDEFADALVEEDSQQLDSDE